MMPVVKKFSVVILSPRSYYPGYRVVCLVLSLLLLTASVLKGYQLATVSTTETSLLTTRWFLLLVVELEFLLAVWLLSDWYPRQARWAALLWFILLLGVALSQVVSGTSSCACFGIVRVLPLASGG